MRLALSETQKTGFRASWPRISTALEQILQVQHIPIFKQIMMRLFIRYVMLGLYYLAALYIVLYTSHS